MGLCFVTEGAIPYAASDPIRVIPSCMVGSAVAGALTSLFNVTCPAPHGGIFTFIVCDHPLLYVVALVAELAISNTDAKFWKPTQWNNVPGGIC